MSQYDIFLNLFLYFNNCIQNKDWDSTEEEHLVRKAEMRYSNLAAEHMPHTEFCGIYIKIDNSSTGTIPP